jgi:hypothetical protein
VPASPVGGYDRDCGNLFPITNSLISHEEACMARLHLARRFTGVSIALLVTTLGASACGDETRAAGVIFSVSPALCIQRAAAQGVCVPGADADGHGVGECVTFTYTGDAGDPTTIRDLRSADPEAHPDDCR